MEIKINLPDTITVTSRGVNVDVAVPALSADIIARLAVHGAVQKIADAASGAAKLVTDEVTVEQATESLMSKARDSLVAGEWTQRTGGGGVDEFTRESRSVVRAIVKQKLGSTSPEWKAFTGLADDEQNAKLDANFAANEKALRPIVEKRIAAKAKERAEKAKLGGEVEIAL